MARIILVTGGAGFIGANLVHELLSQVNTTIHVLAEPGSCYWRLSTILHAITIHEISITDNQRIRQLIRVIKPQEIYHLAAYGVASNQEHQPLIFDVNLNGTINLVNACKEVGFSVFINTGSSAEYGKKNDPMIEIMSLEPTNDYAVAKSAATLFCLKEALSNNLPIYTVRPFLVYGDYEMPIRLIPTILINALQNKPIILGNPCNVRDFIYIKDIVSLYLAIAAQQPTSAHIFNGGSGIQSTTQEVVSTAETVFNQPLTVQWGQAASRPWETPNQQANISLAKNILNWQPSYTLQQGLAASLTWFTNNLTLYHNSL